ncbi:YeeE/YedE thiosulfate transporter family protein [Polynucleobacter brandtiae]|uniref:Uncharacterized protein n=1 Tax=Polynucleobacter brandtiae TaxID=1938816 RepID=A0A2M8VQV2_9BURK|nr:YeeE/YedE thiosulfate transporter family protein [Polynucleobacter brandtiae]PJI79833.1 hypothetical protein B0G85_0810 [Polynucleobacter brandtiae]
MNEIISGLMLGFGFGFVLERAGFGNPNKLTGQFRFTDWSVFKVMFTAIVFTAIGLMALKYLGYIQIDQLFVPPSFLGAAALGGALVGVGFAIGGYCPGTSIVGLMSGRIDAGIFLIGLLLGTVIFSLAYPVIESVTSLGEYAQGDTLMVLLNTSDIYINIAMVIAAIAIFIFGGWMEKRSSGTVCSK